MYQDIEQAKYVKSRIYFLIYVIVFGIQFDICNSVRVDNEMFFNYQRAKTYGHTVKRCNGIM